MFSKTKACRFYNAGKCTKGTDCQFAHSLVELRPIPDLRCTRMCKTIVQCGKCDSPTCPFAHSKAELRTIGNSWQHSLSHAGEQWDGWQAEPRGVPGADVPRGRPRVPLESLISDVVETHAPFGELWRPPAFPSPDMSGVMAGIADADEDVANICESASQWLERGGNNVTTSQPLRANGRRALPEGADAKGARRGKMSDMLRTFGTPTPTLDELPTPDFRDSERMSRNAASDCGGAFSSRAAPAIDSCSGVKGVNGAAFNPWLGPEIFGANHSSATFHGNGSIDGARATPDSLADSYTSSRLFYERAGPGDVCKGQPREVPGLWRVGDTLSL